MYLSETGVSKIGTFFLFISAEAYFADPSFNKNYILINNSFLLLKNIFNTNPKN